MRDIYYDIILKDLDGFVGWEIVKRDKENNTIFVCDGQEETFFEAFLSAYEARDVANGSVYNEN